MSDHQEELGSLVRDLRAHLDWLREAGTSQLPAPPRGAAAAGSRPGSRSEQAAEGGPVRSLRAAVHAAVAGPGLSSLQPPAPARLASPPAAGFQATATSAKPASAPASSLQPPASSLKPPAPLEQLRAELGDCRRCKLAGGRTSLVYGVGDPKAELVFVGEGPGEEEDRQGIPFVGKAGGLLTKMIEAMGFSRDSVYICNVVKCRPPGNRNPEPDEIAACEPFLKAQLASVQPKAIVALGKFASQTLLRDTTPITRLRGQWREYCGIKLMPTFHPAYLLRNPAEKKKVWEDLQQVMREFGKQPRS